jgi:hypothetical protein
MNSVRIVAFAGALAASLPSMAHAGFEGNDIQITRSVPILFDEFGEAQPGALLINNERVTVGPGPELVRVPEDPNNAASGVPAIVDVSDTKIVLHSFDRQEIYSRSVAPHIYATFKDLYDNVDNIAKVTVAAETHYPGFDESRIEFGANYIRIDFAGLSTDTDTVVALNVEFRQSFLQLCQSADGSPAADTARAMAAAVGQTDCVAAQAALRATNTLVLTNGTAMDLGAIAEFDNLEVLVLYNNVRVNNLAVLAQLPNLRELNLIISNVSDLSWITSMPRLETLFLNGNSITDIGPLSRLANIKNLVLSNNSISDLTPLSGLVTLERLDIGNNAVRYVTPLSSLVNLVYLGATGNQIADFSPVQDLPRLERLDTFGNP